LNLPRNEQKYYMFLLVLKMLHPYIYIHQKEERLRLPR
jgi:hypothetical protein